MAHIGSFASFVGGLLAAAGAASAERTSSLVQAAGILVSVVLALLLAFTGGMAALALPALVLYQAAWAWCTYHLDAQTIRVIERVLKAAKRRAHIGRAFCAFLCKNNWEISVNRQSAQSLQLILCRETSLFLEHYL